MKNSVGRLSWGAWEAHRDHGYLGYHLNFNPSYLVQVVAHFVWTTGAARGPRARMTGLGQDAS